MAGGRIARVRGRALSTLFFVLIVLIGGTPGAAAQEPFQCPPEPWVDPPAGQFPGLQINIAVWPDREITWISLGGNDLPFRLESLTAGTAFSQDFEVIFEWPHAIATIPDLEPGRYRLRIDTWSADLSEGEGIQLKIPATCSTDYEVLDWQTVIPLLPGAELQIEGITIDDLALTTTTTPPPPPPPTATPPSTTASTTSRADEPTTSSVALAATTDSEGRTSEILLIGVLMGAVVAVAAIAGWGLGRRGRSTSRDLPPPPPPPAA